MFCLDLILIRIWTRRGRFFVSTWKTSLSFHDERSNDGGNELASPECRWILFKVWAKEGIILLQLHAFLLFASLLFLRRQSCKSSSPLHRCLDLLRVAREVSGFPPLLQLASVYLIYLFFSFSLFFFRCLRRGYLDGN